MRALSLSLVALTCATTALCAAGAQRRALEGGGRRRYHRVQHGRCSYTFVLPEADPLPCPATPGPVPGPANVLLQRDSPAGTAGHGAAQRLRHLERILENSTQWLRKVGCGVCGGWWGVCVCGDRRGGCGQGSVPSTHACSIPVAQLRALGPVPT